MKVKRIKQAVGALVMGVATAAHCQASAPASTTTNTPTANTASTSTNSVKSKPFVKIDGTDLIVCGLPPITFHGFASQGFLASTKYNFLGADTKNGSFDYDEVGLNASMTPFDRTRISAQAFAFDVGRVGYNEPVLDYAMVDHSFSDAFGIRAGRIIRPEGIYNAIQDIDLARTSILLPQGVYDARWRDFSASLDGGSFYGNVDFKKIGSVSYEVYGGMVNLNQAGGGVYNQIQDALVGTGLNLERVTGNPEFGGQLWWSTPVDGLRLGASYTYNDGFTYQADEQSLIPIGGGHTVPLSVSVSARDNVPWQHYSVEYQKGKWTFQGEFRSQTVIGKQTTSEVFGAPLASHNSTAIASSLGTSASWYVGAAYEVNNWFQIGTYYNEYYANLNNLGGPASNFQDDLALSFRFDPKPWWTVKLEGHFIRGTGLLYDTLDNPVQNNGGWFMLAMKTTFSF